MVDQFTPSKRKAIMANIGSKDTEPEKVVRRALHKQGYRFRLHRKDIPGTPDIYLPRYRLAIFVHGCFWHGHKGCKRAKLPSTRKEFWESKIDRNKARDKNVMEELEKQQIRQIVIWQCQLRNLREIIETIENLARR